MNCLCSIKKTDFYPCFIIPSLFPLCKENKSSRGSNCIMMIPFQPKVSLEQSSLVQSPISQLLLQSANCPCRII